MSFTKELNLLNIIGLVLMSVMCFLLSVYFLHRSAEKDMDSIRNMLTEERMNQLKDQVTSAYSVAETSSFYEEAQKSISEMRFGERRQNSFYVVDGDGMFFVNPINPEFLGKIKLGIKDSDGKEYVRDIIKEAKEKGQGIINYRETQNGSGSPLTKMAFFKYYKDWNWIIYAGINVNDIDERIAEIENRISKDLKRQMIFLFSSAFIILCFVIYLNTRLVSARIIEPIKALTLAAEDMSLGNFDKEIDISSNREIKSLSESIERLRVSLLIAIKKLKDRPAKQELEYVG